MYDLHAYARARQIEMEQALRQVVLEETVARPRSIRRIFFGSSPQSRAA